MSRSIATFTLLAFVFSSLLAPVAQAGIVSNAEYVQQVEADAQRAKVVEMLQREDVRDRMLALGVDPASVEDRLDGLTNAEIAQLSDSIEDMPAGAGVIEVLLFVVLVFVILDIAGVTDVFPFINSAD